MPCMDDDQLSRLTRRMADLGAPDPEEWARSELKENFAQQAMYLFLRPIWPEMIDPLNDEEVIRRYPAGQRVLDAGAPLADLTLLLRAVAYETAFGVVERIDEGYDPDAPDDSPGWRLMEVDSELALTGRDLWGLHENLLSLDPSGRQGSDLWE